MYNYGRIIAAHLSSIVSLEKLMTRMRQITPYAALLISALALSACASKPKEEVVAEPAPAVVEQPAEPAPAVVAEQPAAPAVASSAEVAPKPVVRKARKKARVVPPKVEEPEPVAAPAPVVEQAAPVAAPPEPTPPAPVETPRPPVEEQGFLEQYWMWLLGIVVAAVAIFFVVRKKE